MKKSPINGGAPEAVKPPELTPAEQLAAEALLNLIDALFLSEDGRRPIPS